MFDFEKLNVYTKAKDFNALIGTEVLTKNNLNKTCRDQIKRASLSVALNIAEGASRFGIADKRNFIVIARGSLAECVAILDIMRSENIIDDGKYKEFYSKAEEISKMLYAMIRKYESDLKKK